VPAEALPAWRNADDPRFTRVVRAAPPSHSVRRLEKARLVAPCDARRIVMRGGQGDDREIAPVSPGGELPAGAWTTGVAAVVRDEPGTVRADRWEEHVAGFAPFHLVDGALALGPWIVGFDEVKDFRALAFSAFLDDLPCIRPAKALLDWGGVMKEAHAARPLAAGDLLALAAPPRDVPAGSDLRSALVVDGEVKARLTARVALAAAVED